MKSIIGMSEIEINSPGKETAGHAIDCPACIQEKKA